MKTVAVIGAGPAGLMAAEVLSAAGIRVSVFDAMPSIGRKFLLAGKGGLNLTHAEPASAMTTLHPRRFRSCASNLDMADQPAESAVRPRSTPDPETGHLLAA